MTFLAPVVLVGLAAAGIPVAIHLLNKSQVKVMRWAAMQFLLETLRKNERKMKIEDLLLLILRCLIIALLALAFARPAIEGIGRVLSGMGPVSVMIVMDRSASMAYNDGQETRLDAAKRAAIKLLDSFAAESTSGLVLAGGEPDAVIPSPSNDAPLIKRRIQLVECDADKSDLYPAVRLAAEALQEEKQARRQVHIFSDGSAAAWNRASEISRLAGENPGIEFVFHAVGAKETDNTSITSVKTEEANPLAGESLPVIVTIKNWGTEPVRDIRMTARVDRGSPQAEELVSEMGAGEERNVVLNVKLDQPGFHTIEVNTPPDRIPADNTRALAVQTLDRPNILVVSDERAKGSGPSSSFFLSQALLPIPREQLSRAPLSIAEKTPQSLPSLKLAEYNLLVICDPRDPAAMGDVQALLDYVQGGGNLLILPGDNAAARTSPWPEAWNVLLPAVATRVENAPKDKVSFGVQTKGFVHPVLAPWNDPAMGSLASVSVSRRFPLQPSKTSKDGNAPQTVLAFKDGKPALIEWKLGDGHVALAAFPFQSGWTNFHLHPSFLAIIQRLAGSYFSGLAHNLNIGPNAGFSYQVPVDAVGKPFHVRRPDGQAPRAGGQVEARDDVGWLQFRDTASPGPYEIFLDPNSSPLVTFAVQSRPDAGELRYAPADEIDRAVKPGGGTRAAVPETAVSLTPEKGIASELWFPFLALATFLACLEMGLAHRFSQSK